MPRARHTTLHEAIATVLANPDKRTPDMGGSLSTTQMTDAVITAVDTTASGH